MVFLAWQALEFAHLRLQRPVVGRGHHLLAGPGRSRTRSDLSGYQIGDGGPRRPAERDPIAGGRVVRNSAIVERGDLIGHGLYLAGVGRADSRGAGSDVGDLTLRPGDTDRPAHPAVCSTDPATT